MKNKITIKKSKTEIIEQKSAYGLCRRKNYAEKSYYLMYSYYSYPILRHSISGQSSEKIAFLISAFFHSFSSSSTLGADLLMASLIISKVAKA